MSRAREAARTALLIVALLIGAPVLVWLVTLLIGGLFLLVGGAPG